MRSGHGPRSCGNYLEGDQIADRFVLVSVTRDSRAGRVFVKLVNPPDAPAPVRIDVVLVGVARLAPTATAVTLSGDAQATNSIDAPEAGVPGHGIVALMLETR